MAELILALGHYVLTHPIEKMPQTKFDTENFQYHSKSSFAGKNWFMRVENSHAIIIQEPQVNCVICKLETAEVLFYMHDIKNKKNKKKADPPR